MKFPIRYSIILSILILSVSYHSLAEETLTWDACVAEAAKNNPQLISAEQFTKQKSAAEFSAQSGLLPQIDGNMDVTLAESESMNSNGIKKSSKHDNYSYGASASQLIFDGFKTVNDVRAAKETVKAAKYNYRYTSTVVRYDLRSAFIDLLRAQELVTVAGEIEKIRRDNLNLIELRYNSGLEHKGALMTAQANLAQAQYDVAQAQRSVIASGRRLTKAMGRRAFVPIKAESDFSVREKVDEKPDIESIALATPAYLEAAAKTRSADYGVYSAKSDFFPVISGSAGAGKSTATWPPSNTSWDLGLSLTMPLFEGGLRLAKLSQAKAYLYQSQADERDTKDTAMTTLEDAWAAFMDTYEFVNVQYMTLLASEERSRIAAAQYSSGFITFDNWIIIQNDLVSAKKAYLNAQAASLTAEAAWIKAKGETLEYTG